MVLRFLEEALLVCKFLWLVKFGLFLQDFGVYIYEKLSILSGEFRFVGDLDNKLSMLSLCEEGKFVNDVSFLYTKEILLKSTDSSNSLSYMYLLEYYY